MRLELVLMTMVAPRSAMSSISSGRNRMQCANETRSLTQSDFIEIFHDAMRKGAICPGALVASLQQVHVDPAPSVRGCLAYPAQHVVGAPLHRLPVHIGQ